MTNELRRTPKLRLLSAFLAAAMALTTLPAAAFAADVTDYELAVNGKRVTSANATNILDDGKASYEDATRTLTLSGDISVTDNAVNPSGKQLIVTGKSTVTGAQRDRYAGFYSGGEPIKVAADADITLDTFGFGINAMGADISGNMKICNAEYGVNGMGTTVESGGKLTIRDVNYGVSGQGATIKSSGTLEIDGATAAVNDGGVKVYDGGVVTNGMSYHARDGRNANAAVVVSVDGRDFDNDPVKAVAFQRQLEQAAYRAGGGGYLAPAETVGSFLAGRGKLELGAVQPTYPRGVTPCDLGSLLPGELAADLRDGITAFGRKLRAYQAPDAVLTGLETRTSSPVRLLRGDNFQCTGLTGLYPCGEGAGYAGGIMTAAVDGVRCAAALMQQYAPDKA